MAADYYEECHTQEKLELRHIQKVYSITLHQPVIPSLLSRPVGTSVTSDVSDIYFLFFFWSEMCLETKKKMNFCCGFHRHKKVA